ncbi:MAG: response regulator transcription factor [Lachnospiraceae bacterium]|nr:response regulator transcription factor [Lachnospiraceae bacterium]
MAAKHNLLIVEDEKAISNLIATTLETQGYHYTKAKNGNQAMIEIVSRRPEIILLDLGLPDMDGMDIIKKVRTFSSVPIIVISARNEDRDKIEALDAGADDYLTKPFSVEELLARLRSTFRRISYMQGSSGAESTIFENGDLRIDFAAAAVYMKGAEVHLSPIEYRLLCLLARNVGKVLTHQYMMHEVWENVQGSDIPSLRVFMATLRKKIEPDRENPAYIHTRVGIGYKMNRIGAGPDEK